jgi:hypothetical protein
MTTPSARIRPLSQFTKVSWTVEPAPDFLVERRRQARDSARERQERVQGFRCIVPRIRCLDPTHVIEAREAPLAGLTFAYTSVALLLSGFPHVVALGLLAGALEFIPMAGWITAAATIMTIGVVTHGHWIWMAALLGMWRVLIDYWIAPRVLGHELEIHPLLAIFTLMVGGAVGGLAGAYLALPIAAVIRVVWGRLAASPA